MMTVYKQWVHSKSVIIGVIFFITHLHSCRCCSGNVSDSTDNNNTDWGGTPRSHHLPLHSLSPHSLSLDILDDTANSRPTARVTISMIKWAGVFGISPASMISPRLPRRSRIRHVSCVSWRACLVSIFAQLRVRSCQIHPMGLRFLINGYVDSNKKKS